MPAPTFTKAEVRAHHDNRRQKVCFYQHQGANGVDCACTQGVCPYQAAGAYYAECRLGAKSSISIEMLIGGTQDSRGNWRVFPSVGYSDGLKLLAENPGGSLDAFLKHFKTESDELRWSEDGRLEHDLCRNCGAYCGIDGVTHYLEDGSCPNCGAN